MTLKSLGLPVVVTVALAVGGCTALDGADKRDPGDYLHHDFEGRFIDQPSVMAAATEPHDNTGAQTDGVKLEQANGVGVMREASLERYFTGIVDRLAAAWPGPHPNYTVRLTPSDNLPPRAMPDGSIIIPAAAVSGLESEDEFAFVLGHELSHVILQHYTTTSYQDLQHRVYGLASLGIAGYLAYEGKHGNTTGGVTKNAAAASLANTAVLELGDTLLYPSWTRLQEDQADLLGIDLAIAAGYSPLGVSRFFDRMSGWEQQMNQKLEYAAASHMEAIQLAASEGDLKETVNAVLGSAVDVVQTNASELMLTLREDHETAEERKAAARDYIKREYAGVRAPIQEAPLNAARQQKSARAVIAGIADSNLAARALTQKDMASASSYAQQSLQGATKTFAYPRLIAYEVEEQSSGNGPVSNLEIAQRDYAPPVTVTVMLADAYTEKGKTKDATRVLEAAWEEFGEKAPQLFVPMIDNYERRGMKDKANAMRVKCIATGAQELMAQCQRTKSTTREASKGSSTGTQTAKGASGTTTTGSKGSTTTTTASSSDKSLGSKISDKVSGFFDGIKALQ